MSKKINKLETVDDIDKLYEKFKEKALKSFRNGESVEEFNVYISKWIMDKTKLNEEDVAHIILEFLRILLIDDSVDMKETRKEK